jgi:oligopeptide transport system substrate-binding protein
MVTPMYTTEVDWDLAIEQGVADYPGDFSKIEAAEYSIEALDYKYILAGATNYPLDSNGDEHLTEDGEYDREGATTFTDTFWTVNIREDLKFEDGTPITTADFEYTLQQFLDQAQNNYRATIFYKDADNTGGYPLKGADNYFKQVDDEGNAAEVAWSEVGFKIVDDYTFTVEFDEPRSQAAVVGFANDIRLVHQAAYEASLDADGINSNYGNPSNPFVSYGPYIMKSWDANQKIVFNKNFDYVLRETVTYKSQVIEIVPDLATEYNLFKAGSTSVFGLTNDYFAEFAENPNLYFAWNGYPQYLILNTAGSRLAENGHEQPTIMFDVRFRQALFYGFDRNYFGTSVYAPNTPSVLTVPLDTKAYIQDPLYYSESPNHLAVLESFDIDPETNAYIPQRAIELFNAAYADWVAEGNTGPVVLKYVASNSTTLGVNLANYVESAYETLFGADKLDINVVFGDQTSTSAAQRNWDFDIALSAIGFGSSSGIQWQYPMITFLGAIIGGANLGLTQPFDVSVSSEDPDLDGIALYYSEEFTVDLTPTYEYLLSIENDESTPEDFLTLLDWLREDGDKPAGIYVGNVGELGDYLANYATPYDATAAAPFPGATQEVWKIVAAFETVFLNHIPLVPTVTRSSATVYADNVVITWAKYHSGFGWGAARYRYLNTDPDFADGFYNSFAE